MDLMQHLRKLDNIDGSGRKVEGWCTLEKALAMCQLVVEQRPKLCVELGAFAGRSLVATGLGLRLNGEGLAYGIDPWTNDAAIEGTHNPEDAAWWGNVDMGWIHGCCLEAILHFGVARHVRLLACKSAEATGMFRRESIDMLHIDSNHSEEISCAEVTHWMPKVKPGGFVWFDDTDWPTTQRAQAMMDRLCYRVKDVGTCRLYQKLP